MPPAYSFRAGGGGKPSYNSPEAGGGKGKAVDTLELVMVTVMAAGAYLLGRWSTQGNSWESAFNTVNKACDNWREIAAGWEAEAEKWRREAEHESLSD